MPSQENIKSVEVLLKSLSELDVYVDSLKSIATGEKGKDIPTTLLATVGTTKYLYTRDELISKGIITVLLSAASDAQSNILQKINDLLNN